MTKTFVYVYDMDRPYGERWLAEDGEWTAFDYSGEWSNGDRPEFPSAGCRVLPAAMALVTEKADRDSFLARIHRERKAAAELQERVKETIEAWKRTCTAVADRFGLNRRALTFWRDPDSKGSQPGFYIEIPLGVANSYRMWAWVSPDGNSASFVAGAPGGDSIVSAEDLLQKLRQRYDVEYADPSEVVTVRVYSEPRRGVVIEWHIDGVDADNRCTEACWTYDSREEALEGVDEFRGNHHINPDATLRVVDPE